MSVFVCTQCLKQFSKKSNLKRHVDEVHNEDVARFACSHAGCGRLFKRKHDRDVHEASHVAAGVTPSFACAERRCTARFAKLEQLLEHINTVHSLPVTSALIASTTTTAAATVAAAATMSSLSCAVSSTASTASSSTTASTAATAPITSVLKRASADAGGEGVGERPLKRFVRNMQKSSVSVNQLIDAANNNMLVRHDNHIDAIVGGRLVSLQDLGNNELVAVEHSLRTPTPTSSTSQTNAAPPEPSHCKDDHGDIHSRCRQHNCISPLRRTSFDTATTNDVHVHGSDCGHLALVHEEHDDYLIGHDLYCPIDNAITAHMSLIQKSDIFGNAVDGVDDWLDLLANETKQ